MYTYREWYCRIRSEFSKFVMYLFMKVIFLMFLLLSPPAFGVKLPSGVEHQAKVESVKQEGQDDSATETESLVSILCYHDFTAKYKSTEMRIREKAFETQMKAVKESGVNVITMEQFIAWKQGELKLPARNILITIDDGWRSVYIVAYPILKKYGFPFTLGLYNDFIGKGDLSLTRKMIKEMMANGMELSSHSVTHPFPSVVKKERAKTTEEYKAFLDTELGYSKAFLEKEFGVDVSTYIYPGGYFTDDMFSVLRDFQYNYAFTVKPAKVSRDTTDFAIPRYVVMGTTDRLFKAAMTFKKTGSASASVTKLPFPVKPVPGQLVKSRLPWIGMDLEADQTIERESIVMRVSGFGKVNGRILKDTSRYEWQATRPLRAPYYTVQLQWKKKGAEKYEPPIQWKFSVDHQPTYLRKEEGQ